MQDLHIKAEEILLKDLFGSKFLFKIPSYQRPFSWGIEHFEEIFEDICESMELDEDYYFLGSIILQERSFEDNSVVYDVIDGQQRLTTLSILLAVMRDLSNDPGAREALQRAIYQPADVYYQTSEKARVSIRDRDMPFYRRYILEEGGTLDASNVLVDILSDSQRRMLDAITTFQKGFRTASDVSQDFLRKMIIFVLNRCAFVYIKTGTLSSAYRLFSILNDRGLPLTTADLLKSLNLGAISEHQRPQYQQLWEDIEANMEGDELEKLLGHIRLMLIREKARKSMIDEYTNLIFDRRMSKGRPFVEYLYSVASLYSERVLNAELDCEGEIEVKFHNLMSLMRDFLPSSEWVAPFLSFALKFYEPQHVYEFLLKLERRALVNWIRGSSRTERINMAARTIKLIESSEDPEVILSHDSFDNKEYRTIIEQILNAPDFYYRNFCKYVLLRLNLSLAENANVKIAYGGTISVEHVLPQHPKKNSYWTRHFSKEDREQYTHMLGNLVLLSRRKNSRANNRSFRNKKKSYYTRGITDFEITKQLKDYDDWNVNVIKERHSYLANHLLSLLV